MRILSRQDDVVHLVLTAQLIAQQGGPQQIEIVHFVSRHCGLRLCDILVSTSCSVRLDSIALSHYRLKIVSESQ